MSFRLKCATTETLIAKSVLQINVTVQCNNNACGKFSVCLPSHPLEKISRSGWYLLQTVNRFSRLLEKKVKFNTHYFLAIILATKCLINFLPNHRNKNVDIFIVLVIDVFSKI